MKTLIVATGLAFATSALADLPKPLGTAPAPAAASLAATARSGEEAQVEATFTRYRNALLQKDGKAAADAVDDATIGYYATMRELALHADRALVKKQSFLDRMCILRLRLQIPAASLQGMGGRELFGYAVEQGWISASSVQSAGLGAMTIAGDEAKASLLVNGRLSGASFVFKRSERGWRLSLVPLFAMGEPVMKDMAKQVGKEEDVFLFDVLEQLSGKPVPETIWAPLVARTK